MSEWIRSAKNQDGEALPVGRIDAANGVRIPALIGSSTASAALPAGVYLISCTVPVFLSVAADPVSGDAAGSLLLGPGGVLPLVLAAGDCIAARAVDVDGAVLAVPLTSA